MLTGTFGGDLAHMSMAATFPDWYPDLERREGVTQVREPGVTLSSAPLATPVAALALTSSCVPNDDARR